ncbi:MAG: hypothetical protein J7K21_05135 [Desulfurococcales archaeon]|nr:hypothetical protein [Desulfurococcales archaeon]
MARSRRVVYEDSEIVVLVAPRDEELGDVIIDTIREKGRPMTWDELREEFSGIAGEDRLRRALNKLVDMGILVEFPDGSYGLPGMELPPERRGIRKRRRRRRIPRIYTDTAVPRPYYIPSRH